MYSTVLGIFYDIIISQGQINVVHLISVFSDFFLCAVVISVVEKRVMKSPSMVAILSILLSFC